MTSRVVVPEILDSLSPSDPGAIANRRDLRRINFLMGNWRWIRRELRSRIRPGIRIVEAGAGEGDLGNFLHQSCLELRLCSYEGLDLWGRPSVWPESWDWNQIDLLAYHPSPPPHALVVNLLLHQFQDEELRGIGQRIAEIPLWIINEPHRAQTAIWQLALLRLFGLHPVSWHDGRVSIRGGFRGRELAALLSSDSRRRFQIQTDWRGGYRLVSWLVN
ncbi:MAG: hypothetical protein AAGJ81_09700 [Verrucomicrobiota bacterium]